MDQYENLVKKPMLPPKTKPKPQNVKTPSSTLPAATTLQTSYQDEITALDKIVSDLMQSVAPASRSTTKSEQVEIVDEKMSDSLPAVIVRTEDVASCAVSNDGITFAAPAMSYTEQKLNVSSEPSQCIGVEHGNIVDIMYTTEQTDRQTVSDRHNGGADSSIIDRYGDQVEISTSSSASHKPKPKPRRCQSTTCNQTILAHSVSSPDFSEISSSQAADTKAAVQQRPTPRPRGSMDQGSINQSAPIACAGPLYANRQEVTYENSNSLPVGRHDNVAAVPLLSVDRPHDLKLLSKEDIAVFDPNGYLSLWELSSMMKDVSPLRNVDGVEDRAEANIYSLSPVTEMSPPPFAPPSSLETRPPSLTQSPLGRPAATVPSSAPRASPANQNVPLHSVSHNVAPHIPGILPCIVTPVASFTAPSRNSAPPIPPSSRVPLQFPPTLPPKAASVNGQDICTSDSSKLGPTVPSRTNEQLPSAQLPSAQLLSAQLPSAQLPSAQLPSVQVPSALVPSAMLPCDQVPCALAPSAQSDVQPLAAQVPNLLLPLYRPHSFPDVQSFSVDLCLPPVPPRNIQPSQILDAPLRREPDKPGVTSQEILLPIPVRGPVSVQKSESFRVSFMPSLPADPFADEGNIFSFDHFPQRDFPSATPTNPSQSHTAADGSLQVDSSEKLVPRRTAPPPPAPPSTLPIYSQINKQKSKEDTCEYYLAEETENCFDNPAVSYDSEETAEDSDEDEDDADDYCPTPDLQSKLPLMTPTRSCHAMRHGYLYKQGGKQNNKGWRRRYVTFDGAKLRYFSSQKSRVSKRVIPVRGMIRVENEVKDADNNRFKFKVLTQHRTFLFAAETLEDQCFWTNILMKAIIEYCKQSQDELIESSMPGGDMSVPDKEGYIKMDDNKRYMALKGTTLCYYNNQKDFMCASPIHEISLDTASIKDLTKSRLQLTTPYQQYILTCETEADAESWRFSVEEGIAAALSDDNVLNEVYTNPSNRRCADCHGPNPHWAVLHLCTVICGKCAGVHRQFWPQKVKSLRMDFKIWSKQLVALLVSCGNGIVNELWEADPPSNAEQINESSTLSQRKLYIVKKYNGKLFFRKADLPQSSVSASKEALFTAIKKDSLLDTMHLINAGVSVSSVNSDGQSALDYAKMLGRTSLMEYLKVNGADGESFADFWRIMNNQQSGGSPEKKVLKSGYLCRITTNSKKEYPRQWLLLTEDTLKCFDDERDSEPKATFRIHQLVSVAIHNQDRGEPSFEITHQSSQPIILGAEQWEDINSWMSSICKVAAPATAKQTESEFSRAGFLHCKDGSLGKFTRCWAVFRNKLFTICSCEGSWTKEVDLRKVCKITSASRDDTELSADDSGLCIVINLPNTCVYLYSELRKDTEAWLTALHSSFKETSQILEEQHLNKENVPVLVDRCVNFIFLHGMTTPGIYRESGTHTKVTTLLTDLINGAQHVHMTTEEYNVHDVANVLKRYLRNLQNPVMTSSLYGSWISTAMLYHRQTSFTDHEMQEHYGKLYKYKELLERLPTVNHATLKLLIRHLNRVSGNQECNRMSIINLATVFGPVLLAGSLSENGSPQSFQNTNFEIQVVMDLIQYYQWLFDVDDSEIRKELEIEAKIEEMRRAIPQPTAPAGEFILGIYMYNNLDEPINMKVSAAMTPIEILKQVQQLKKIPRVDGYGLFEVACNGDLERPLKESEKVLEASLASSTWNPEHSRGNYLCVKEDYLKESIDSAFGPDVTRFTELQYCQKKSWKKLYFEINQTQLISYKDRSDSSRLTEWNVNDLVLYVGVERKRKPPTKFGVTFLVLGESPEKLKDSLFLGRSICFTSEEEMTTWLASIFNAQSASEGRGSSSVMSKSFPSMSSISGSQEKKNLSEKLRQLSKRIPFKK